MRNRSANPSGKEAPEMKEAEKEVRGIRDDRHKSYDFV
jgi:hypothetical protein